jgi:hypothetical protein
MKFRTEIKLEKALYPINHEESILTIGSCFAENIAEYLRYSRFNVISNPFGVLYNPVSIMNSFKILKEGRKFSEFDLVYDQGEWHSFYHHSDFSHHDKNVCLDKINSRIAKASDFLIKADRIIITLGTAYVYNYIKNDIIVSNCHKIAAENFSRYLLSLEAIVDTIESIVNLLKEINPSVRILFTVSPIRHWKDGAVGNQVSKAQLILAVAEIVNRYENCGYFPAYEIMMDDLRDYRFYDSDLLHPNTIATDYIWELFIKFMLSKNCNALISEIEKVVKAAKHRVRNPHSEANKKFALDNLKLIDNLSSSNPHINLETEKKYFQSFL